MLARTFEGNLLSYTWRYVFYICYEYNYNVVHTTTTYVFLLFFTNYVEDYSTCTRTSVRKYLVSIAIYNRSCSPTTAIINTRNTTGVNNWPNNELISFPRAPKLLIQEIHAIEFNNCLTLFELSASDWETHNNTLTGFLKCINRTDSQRNYLNLINRYFRIQ